VPAQGVMTDNNVHATCQRFGMETPCAGAAGCRYNNNICTLTSEVGCGNPMRTTSQSLCNTNPGTCDAMNQTYTYMGNTWNNGGSCGEENNSWCTNGNSYSDRFAFCARRQ
jgi:hypothetical protein